MKKPLYNINRGDLKKVAEETGLSYSMVKKVSSGKNKNVSIHKALIAITIKRNAIDKQIVKNLQATIV